MCFYPCKANTNYRKTQMIVDINGGAWEALNGLYGEEVCERLTLVLNEKNESALCHDFDVCSVDFGMHPPNISYREESIHLEYTGTASIELCCVLGLDTEHDTTNLDLLTGLLSTLSRSVQLPLRLQIILSTLHISVNLANGLLTMHTVDLEVNGQVAGSKSEWVRQRVKRELLLRLEEIIKSINVLDVLSNWPTQLAELASKQQNKRTTRPSLARTVKSMRSRITFK